MGLQTAAQILAIRSRRKVCLASLLRQGGVDVWLDVNRLAPGDLWMDQLEAALVTAKHFIVYIGPSGVRNWVGREVRFALDRSTRDRSFRLIWRMEQALCVDAYTFLSGNASSP